jgi:mono/diheme cytochrome c family protein
MIERQPSHPLVRPHFMAARCVLVALSLVLAMAAGCGGDKPSGAADRASTTPTPPGATTQAPGETTGAAAEPAGSAADLGSQVFVKRCVLCHGAEGRGDGLASKGLNPKPRNFSDQSYMKTRTDAQLLEVIHKGKGVMPRWEGQLTEAEMVAVLAHVRRLGATN